MIVSFYLNDSETGQLLGEAALTGGDDPGAALAAQARDEGGVILSDGPDGEEILVDDLLSRVIERFCVEGAGALLEGRSYRYAAMIQGGSRTITVADGQALVDDEGLAQVAAPPEEFADALLACAERYATLTDQAAALAPRYEGAGDALRARIAEIRARD